VEKTRKRGITLLYYCSKRKFCDGTHHDNHSGVIYYHQIVGLLYNSVEPGCDAYVESDQARRTGTPSSHKQEQEIREVLYLCQSEHTNPKNVTEPPNTAF
jgi:hypothetical protein